jgi:hypothetical protein
MFKMVAVIMDIVYLELHNMDGWREGGKGGVMHE